MSIITFIKSKRGVSAILVCSVVFVVALLISSFVAFYAAKKNTNLTETQFNWESYRRNSDQAAGPLIGERIDLSTFVETSGKSLKDSVVGKPIMLAVVAPACRACEVSVDQMKQVKGGLGGAANYYTVTVNYRKENEKFFKYAEKLGVDAPAFIRPIGEKPILDALSSKVVPSHILVDSDGFVIQRWTGTNWDPNVRSAMAAQIVNETLSLIPKK